MSGNERMKVTLLGTGCPAPSLTRSGPSQVVWGGDQPLLVDCGPGALFQLLRAEIDLKAVRHLFITHHHWDHLGGFLDFVIGSWIVGRSSLQIFGPPGTARMTQALFGDIFKEDIEYRLSVRHSAEGIRDIQIVDFDEGVIYAEGGWKVTAAKVAHSTNLECFGFRFEFGGQTSVISGDTAYCQAVVDLARRADILVQECSMHRRTVPEIPWLTAKMWERLLEEHSGPREAGKIAREAGVKKLALSHLLPSMKREETLAECAQEFDGEIYIGEDLMEIKA